MLSSQPKPVCLAQAGFPRNHELIIKEITLG